MVAQGSKARGQRSTKRHPGNGWSSGGTVPRIAASGWPRLAVSGSAENSICAYGCRGRAKKSAVSATSTTWPAYMSATRWAICATMPRSWVISNIAMPCWRCRSASRSRICFWIVTSSAVVGSSAITTSGSAASAMAIITRCFCPPDNWNG